MPDEDLIVLGAQAETPAAGGETSTATETPQTEGQTAGGEDTAATPGNDPADPTAEPKPDAPKPEPKDDGEDEDRPNKKRTGIQRMQERIARLEAENQSLRGAAPAAGEDRNAAIEKEIGAPPKEADFQDYAAFDRAQRQYDVKLALAEQRHADRTADAGRRTEAARAEALEAFQDQIDEAKQKLPDYDKVTANLGPDKFKPHVLELVVESEKGALLGYYFGQKPAELEKLNRMSPIAAAKAVGALETRLTLAKPKAATSAPAPAKPISGTAAATPDPSKMSFAEYEKWRSAPKG